jgi:glycosyltransferase involved in cell wall biosynthesis
MTLCYYSSNHFVEGKSMINGQKIVVVLPAYNAELTLTKTYSEIPMDIVDDVILVDDCSNDNTVNIAKKLGIKHIIRHEKNTGYGGNQKTCYKKALSLNADIIIMLHPDYQYTPKLIPCMAYMIANNIYPIVLGSRILGRGALKGGMPLYKILCLDTNFLNIIPAIEHSLKKYSMLFILNIALTILFLTTKYSRKLFQRAITLLK